MKFIKSIALAISAPVAAVSPAGIFASQLKPDLKWDKGVIYFDVPVTVKFSMDAYAHEQIHMWCGGWIRKGGGTRSSMYFDTNCSSSFSLPMTIKMSRSQYDSLISGQTLKLGDMQHNFSKAPKVSITDNWFSIKTYTDIEHVTTLSSCEDNPSDLASLIKRDAPEYKRETSDSGVKAQEIIDKVCSFENMPYFMSKRWCVCGSADEYTNYGAGSAHKRQMRHPNAWINCTSVLTLDFSGCTISAKQEYPKINVTINTSNPSTPILNYYFLAYTQASPLRHFDCDDPASGERDYNYVHHYDSTNGSEYSINKNNDEYSWNTWKVGAGQDGWWKIKINSSFSASDISASGIAESKNPLIEK